MRFKRTWKSRRNELVQRVQECAGIDDQQLADALEQDERLGDVYITAADRAVRVGDAFYREALANLVAAALDDATKIDVVEALIDRLVSLQVESVRLLYELYRPRAWPNHSLMISGVLRELRENGHPTDRVEPALAQLEAAGFVEREWTVEVEVKEIDESADGDVRIEYSRTDWGREAFKICLAHTTPPSGA